jgi:hypothetical protein
MGSKTASVPPTCILCILPREGGGYVGKDQPALSRLGCGGADYGWPCLLSPLGELA